MQHHRIDNAGACIKTWNADFRQVLPSFSDGSVDCVIADPPYGTTDLAYDRRDKVDLVAMWEMLGRIVKPKGVMVMFAAQPFATDLINSARKWFRYEIIWIKNIATGHLNARLRPMRSHENMLVFSREFKGSTYNPQFEAGKPYVSKGGINKSEHYTTKKMLPINNKGTRYPRTVKAVDCVSKGRIHPSQKPVELLEWLVKTYSNPGETILDLFMGSGATGEAAIANGRHFLGIEREEAYYEKTSLRLNDVCRLAA